MKPPSTDEDEPRTRRRRRRRRPMLFMTGGGLLLATLIAALIGQSQDWGETEAPSSAAPPPAASPAPGHTADGEPGDTRTGQPRQPDWDGLTYMDVHGAQLPLSPRYGPQHATEERAAGFSHNIGGAVLATIHLATRVSPQVEPKVYGPNVERMQADPGGRSAFLAQLDADYAKAREASGLPDGEPLRIYAQVIGYAAPDVSDERDEVTVHLLSRGAGPDGGEVLVSVPVTVVWSDGDWALQVPPSGRWPGQPVAGTAGYTLFPSPGER